MKQLWVEVEGEAVPVRVNHWWPKREYAGPSPIPPIFIKEAQKRGSKYLTMASVAMPNMEFVEVAYCNPVDTPSRKMGRHIALGRMEKTLTKAGYNAATVRG